MKRQYLSLPQKRALEAAANGERISHATIRKAIIQHDWIDTEGRLTEAGRLALKRGWQGYATPLDENLDVLKAHFGFETRQAALEYAVECALGAINGGA